MRDAFLSRTFHRPFYLESALQGRYVLADRMEQRWHVVGRVIVTTTRSLEALTHVGVSSRVDESNGTKDAGSYFKGIISAFLVVKRMDFASPTGDTNDLFYFGDSRRNRNIKQMRRARLFQAVPTSSSRLHERSRAGTMPFSLPYLSASEPRVPRPRSINTCLPIKMQI